MALIDLDKFVASFITEMKECSQMRNFSIPVCIKKALEEQGLEYKEGEIVKSQRRVSAEAKENGYGESEDEKIRKWLINLLGEMQYHHCDDEREMGNKALAWLERQGTSYTKRDVDDAYVEGMAFAKDELEKQKPTWSEEDEARLQSCLNILQVQAKGFMGITETINTKWLKSLKQRYTWKPSKEQMDAMQMAVSYFGYSWTSKEQKLLESLYKDLKKLKGE